MTQESNAIMKRLQIAAAQLRRQQLTESGTFLLSKEGLVSGLSRMEYADGRIALVKLDPKQITFILQRWLSLEEEETYRQLHQLPRL